MAVLQRHAKETRFTVVLRGSLAKWLNVELNPSKPQKAKKAKGMAGTRPNSLAKGAGSKGPDRDARCS